MGPIPAGPVLSPLGIVKLLSFFKILVKKPTDFVHGLALGPNCGLDLFPGRRFFLFPDRGPGRDLFLFLFHRRKVLCPGLSPGLPLAGLFHHHVA